MKIFIVAQVIGILGMMMNVISFQAKKQKNILIMQFFGSLFFAVNMYLLDAYTGAILNTVGIVRAITYVNKDKIKNIRAITALFIGLFVLSYVAAFTVFHKPLNLFNIIIELLPVIAMSATTISFSMATSASVRKFALISSPTWLIYNCFNLAIGGIICESLSLVSVISAMVRYDIGKGQKHENANS